MTPFSLRRLPRTEYIQMAMFVDEVLKAERDARVKAALRAKVPLQDIAENEGMTEAEIHTVMVGMFNVDKKPKDALE